MTQLRRPDGGTELETVHEIAREETLGAIKGMVDQLPKAGPRNRIPLTTGDQFGLSIAAAVVRLTVPDTATSAELYVRTAAIVFKRGGGDPTATEGFQANPADIILLPSRAELTQFRAIRQGAASATVDVEYFRDQVE